MNKLKSNNNSNRNQDKSKSYKMNFKQVINKCNRHNGYKQLINITNHCDLCLVFYFSVSILFL